MDDEYEDFAIKTTSPNIGQGDETPTEPDPLEVQDVKIEHLSDEESLNIDDIIKEEYFAVEDEVDPENNEEEKEGVRLTSLPIVFTTRLDDMNILQPQKDYSTKKYILNSILKESIPKYKNQKPVTKPRSKRSYIALIQKLNHIGIEVVKCDSFGTIAESSIKTSLDAVLQKAQISKGVYLRNEKLIKTCKPFSVVLERILLRENGKILPSNRYICDQRPLPNKYNQFLFADVACLIFLDYSRKLTDVYCVISDEMRENFTLKNTDDAVILPYISEYIKEGINPRTLRCCCWHKRELFITSLDLKTFNANIKEFMKKPHYCEFDQCICCCRPRNDKKEHVAKNAVRSASSDIMLDDIKFKDLEKEMSATLCGIKQNTVQYGYKSDWLENLLDRAKSVPICDTLVSKALNYTRPSSALTEVKTKPEFKNLKTKSVLRLNSNDKVEFYELQEEGDVVAYVKENPDSTYEKSLNKRCVVLDSNNPISCCWYKREQIVSKLDLKTTSLKRILKLPHTCLPENCSCCCKPQETFSPLINSALPNQTILTHSNTMKKKNTYTINENATEKPLPTTQSQVGQPVLPNFKPQTQNVKPPIEILPKLLPSKISHHNIPSRNPGKKVNIQSHHGATTVLPPGQSIQYVTIPQSNTYTINENATEKPLPTTQSQVGQPVLPNFKPQTQNVKPPIKILPKLLPSQISHHNIPSRNPGKKVNIQSQHGATTVLPPGQSIQYVTIPQSIDSAQEFAVDSLITTILDRFKDVRLTINEDGRVAAALNAPVNTLTTAELKVLANILGHAQTQVKALGLRPGSLLNAKDVHDTVNFVNKTQGMLAKVVPVNTNYPTDSQTTGSSTQTITQSKIQSNMQKEYTIINQRKIEPIPKHKLLSNFPNKSQNNSSSQVQSYTSINKNKIQSDTQTEHTIIQQKIETIPKHKLLRRFSNMSQNNSSSLMQSYTSFINRQTNTKKKDQNIFGTKNDLNENFVPIISQVFSLKDAENNQSLSESIKSSALNAWSESENSKSAPKRKAVNSEQQPPSKIRVVNPEKLGITGTSSMFENTSAKLSLLAAQLQSNSTQPTFTILPSSGAIGSGIIQSLPRLSNAELPRTTSTITNNENNIIVMNSLGSVGPKTGDTNNVQLVTPLNINTLTQNIQITPNPTKSGTVFTISNLDRATIANPRLLNAHPVLESPLLLLPMTSNDPQSRTEQKQQNKTDNIQKHSQTTANPRLLNAHPVLEPPPLLLPMTSNDPENRTEQTQRNQTHKHRQIETCKNLKQFKNYMLFS